jgi:hypothetical protein
MNQKFVKNPWYSGLIGAIALIGLGAGLFVSRTAPSRPLRTARSVGVPLPALDRVVAQLAAEARATRLAVNSARPKKIR